MYDYKLLTDDANIINSPEFGMVQLAHNQFFIKDGEAWYRDFERELSCRDLVREIAMKQGLWESGCAEIIDNESLDATLYDDLQYGADTQAGILAMYYTAMWGMADVRAWIMEKQTPQKVIKTDTCSQACPVCMQPVNNRFCGGCGQALIY